MRGGGVHSPAVNTAQHLRIQSQFHTRRRDNFISHFVVTVLQQRCKDRAMELATQLIISLTDLHIQLLWN